MGEGRKKQRARGKKGDGKREPGGLCASGAMFSSWRITTSRRDEEKRAKERDRGQRKGGENEGKSERREQGDEEGPTSRRQSWSSCFYVLHTLAERGERTCTCYCIVAHNVQSSLRRFLRL